MHLPVTHDQGPRNGAGTTTPAPPGLAVSAVRPAATTWGRRRLLAALALAPVVFAFLVQSGGGWTPAATTGWLALVVVAAVIGALTLASYVPARGQTWRDTLGCSPCAAVSGGTVIAAAFLLSAAPHEISTALPAVVVAIFGLVQRTQSTTTCST